MGRPRKTEQQNAETTDIEKENTPQDPEMSFGEKNIDTKTVNFSDKLKQLLAQIEDIASAEVMMPVRSRMFNRKKAIEKASKARNLRVDGNWKTFPPKMHIVGLTTRLISQTEAEVTFSVYESNKNGDKIPTYHYADIPQEDGSTKKKVASAEYRVAYDVKEHIRYRKPIQQEIIRRDDIAS